jgi:hypothetical protein
LAEVFLFALALTTKSAKSWQKSDYAMLAFILPRTIAAKNWHVSPDIFSL